MATIEFQPQSSSQPTVLVTGGAGYVGSHVALELLPHYRVVVFDNLSRGHRSLVPPDVAFVAGELQDTDALTAVLCGHGVSAVLHFAAFAYVGESVTDPDLYFHNNIGGTLSLLEAMRRASIGRIVFSSSCTVYGPPEALPMTEEHRLAPISPYGQSKVMCEQALHWHEQAYGLRFCALRYFNAAGCDLRGRSGELHDPEPHVIPSLLQAAAGFRPAFTVLGDRHPTADGSCVRDYIHVNDLAVAHRYALEWLASGRPSLTANLGTGRGVSVWELIAAAEEITGRRVPVEIGPPRPGDPAELVADATRARETLGWSPRHSDLGTILGSAWRWMERQSRAQSAFAQSAGAG